MTAGRMLIGAAALAVIGGGAWLGLRRLGNDTGTADRHANAPAVAAGEVAGRSPDQVAALLVDRWLARFRSPDTGGAMRLQDYRVDRLELVEIGDATVVSATFSVRPTLRSMDSWIAGSGGTVRNGWIHGKFTRFRLTPTVDGYRLTELGPGPL